MTALRGIRGAITARNSKKEIVAATERLLKKMIRSNRVAAEDVASIVFSVTRDLNAEFPAIAARKLGWVYTPLLCTYEIDVPGSLRSCIRVLMHVNSNKKQSHIKHVYLGRAKALRPDLHSRREGLYYVS